MTSITREIDCFVVQLDYFRNKLPDGQVTLFPDTSFSEETEHQARKKTDRFVYRDDYVRC
jgi:hypothetical protein